MTADHLLESQKPIIAAGILLMPVLKPKPELGRDVDERVRFCACSWFQDYLVQDAFNETLTSFAGRWSNDVSKRIWGDALHQWRTGSDRSLLPVPLAAESGGWAPRGSCCWSNVGIRRTGGWDLSFFLHAKSGKVFTKEMKPKETLEDVCLSRQMAVGQRISPDGQSCQLLPDQHCVVLSLASLCLRRQVT